MTAAQTIRCRSIAQFASLGPVPPRTAGRPDAQTPEDTTAGPSKYAFIPHVYFYDASNAEDAAFGFIEIAIAVQMAAPNRYELQLYCAGDGHQSGAGLAGANGLTIELLGAGETVASIVWPFARVSAGRCDPMSFRANVALSDTDFARIDCVRLPAQEAICRFG